MLNTLLVRLQMATLAAVAYIAGGAQRRVGTARGANMVEYALLAAIAVGLGYVFRSQLGNAFDGLLGTINQGLTDNAQNN